MSSDCGIAQNVSEGDIAWRWRVVVGSLGLRRGVREVLTPRRDRAHSGPPRFVRH
jgi:hypothetical protein